jgi:nitroimidazol reductase NimA-like FMN-containing flavoprotein (pyridoxamine 5'-phosphate oxidase superfamily)
MQMIEKMKNLVREKDTCVLATVSEGNPHCSLMSYVAASECREIYMVTHRQTKKYRNLSGNDSVSLLIDTRVGAGKEEIKALTVGGVFQKIEGAEKLERVRKALLARHRGLRALLEDPGAEIFSVRVKSFQLLEGIRDATYIEVE